MRSSRPLALILPLLALCLLAPAAVQAKTSTKVKVPAVAGKKIPAAKALLHTAGLKATVVRQASASVRAGRAIGTTPAAGHKVKRGATVKLLVSSGTPKAITYQGRGVVDTLGVEGDTLDVGFSDVNASLETLLSALDDEDDGVLPVAVDGDTEITVSRTDDQESGDDLSFACVGDDVSVTVVSPNALSALDGLPATSVAISSGDNTDCDVVTVDEDDPDPDGDPSVDDGGGR